MPKGSVVTGGVFIVVCFVIAFLALRVILRFIDKRDAVLRTANSESPQKTKKSYAKALLRHILNGAQIVVGRCGNSRPQGEP